MSKHKLNIHYRGSLWGSRTQQHAYCLHYAPSQNIESHLGKKQLQAKIPIAFLFSQLHFNNATSHTLFYGGHVVMRSAKPGNHLNRTSPSLLHTFVADTTQLSIAIQHTGNSFLNQHIPRKTPSGVFLLISNCALFRRSLSVFHLSADLWNYASEILLACEAI